MLLHIDEWIILDVTKEFDIGSMNRLQNRKAQAKQRQTHSTLKLK